MSWRLALVERFFPLFLRKGKLRELHILTARAFGKDKPAIRSGSFEDELRGYALFTRQAASEVLGAAAREAEVSERLFENAREWGGRLRSQLGVRSEAEARRALRVMYRAIRIDLTAGPDGRVVVRKCYFSDHYGPEVCRLISALDRGLVAGVADGAKLEFDQRITEGRETCLGRILFRRKQS